MRNLFKFLVLSIITARWFGNRSHAASANSPPLAQPAEQYVFVSGGVFKPGHYLWFTGMTVVDAVWAAGGFINSPSRKVWIIQGNRKRGVNKDAFYFTKKPLILSAGDCVSVPEKIS